MTCLPRFAEGFDGFGGRSVSRLTVLAAMCLLGCAGDPAADSGEASESSSESGSETESSTSNTQDDSETGSEALIDGELEIITFETQPMVVDVIVRLTESADFSGEDTAQWADVGDEGVHFALMESSDDGLEHRFRARGLAPATFHTLSVELQVGSQSQGAIAEFTSLAPLPGFVPSVDVEGTSSNPESYRLFDWSSIDGRPGGAIQIDPGGRTRWYYGQEFEPGDIAIAEGLKLLDNGNFAYTHEEVIHIRNELNESVWELASVDVGDPQFHHEVIFLPNGNLMVLGRVFDTVDYGAEGEFLIAGDAMLEYNLGGELVWSWSTLDHLDPLRVRDGFHAIFPAIIDPQSGEQAKDWSHANGIVYDESTDTLLLSLRHQDWILAVDHGTGDLLWRLGDGGDFDLLEGEWFFHQHSPQWQPDGSLHLYDNGNGNPYLAESEWTSRGVRYALDLDAMTATQVWQDDGEPIRSIAMGDIDRMPGGEVMILDSVIDLDIDFAIAYSVLRELDLDATPQEQWRVTTDQGRISYRAMPVQRLVGEVAP